MRFQSLITLLAALAIFASACSSPAASAAEKVDVPVSQETLVKQPAAGDCPVTQAPKVAFVPPAPWPAEPPDRGDFWYGAPGLWTALPAEGSWGQLARGEKFWWWSEEFDVSEDDTPDLTISARRLDGKAAPYQVTEATNGYHQSFHWAMLAGVELPSPGCWEFTGEYKGHELSFVLWVPE